MTAQGARTGTTTKRRRRDPYSRIVVRLPERDLAESILYLAAPLLRPLGSMPPVAVGRRLPGAPPL